MRLKSYFAGTVEAAMALAREELGPEAMLIQSKRAMPEARHAGRYEVVFALEEPTPSAPPHASATPAPDFGQLFAEQRDSAIRKLSADLAALKHRIEGISAPAVAPVALPERAAAAAAAADPAARNARRARETADQLLGLDVAPDIAEAIAREADANGFAAGALREAVRSRVAVDATLGVAGASRKVVALAGPPGAGKTSALVKLATLYGLTARRSIHLMTTDVFRVGAAEQLRLYASILGVGFQAIETPLALAQALEEHRRKDLVFIDTPGWVRRDIPEIRELAAYMASDPDIDVHLVLPASNRGCDIERMMDRYAVFRPAKLLFTRLDETERYGPLVNQSHRSGKPVSFLSGGERIPEDLEPATVERITELLLGRQPEADSVPVEEAH